MGAKKIKRKFSRECPVTCAACCDVLAVEALKKPELTPCRFDVGLEGCGTAHGRCGIYERRPAPCREFECVWKIDPGFPSWATPEATGLLATFGAGKFGIVVGLDELFEGAREGEKAKELLERLKTRGTLAIVRSFDRQKRIVIGPPHRVEEVEAALSSRYGKGLKIAGEEKDR